MAKKVYVGFENFTKSNLPYGYTQIEYIQSSGTQYIDTGFKPNNNTRVLIDAQATGTFGTYFLFGARQSNTSNSFCFFHYNGWAADFQTSDQRKTFSGVEFKARLSVDFNKKSCTVNGSSMSFKNATFQSPVSMALLAVNTNGIISSNISAKLYSCKVYDNGTLVRDFLPAKNSAGTIGLYDLVNGVFYTNAGSGSFTEGSTYKSVSRYGKKMYFGGIDNLACKVKKGYIGDNNGIARLMYALYDPATAVITYTGDYTDELVTMDDSKYRLLTLTSSGTLTVEDDLTADIWLCGGGTSGVNSAYLGSSRDSNGAGGGGGAGAYFTEQDNYVIKVGTHTAVIGSGGSGIKSVGGGTNANKTGNYNGGGTTTFDSIEANSPASGSVSPNMTGVDGASGGGAGYCGGFGNSSLVTQAASGGSGAGLSTVPFLSSYFQPHCSGGQGGADNHYNSETDNDRYRNGKPGGEDGTEGSSFKRNESVNTSSILASSPSIYGSGGRGGGCSSDTAGNNTTSGSYSGSGKQGVIYIRIPI